MLSLKASVYKIKGFSKFEWTIISVIIILFLMSSKVFYLLLFHTNGMYFSFSICISSYIGLVMFENPLIYCQQKKKRPNLNLNSFKFLDGLILTIFSIFLRSILILFLLIMCLRNFSSFFAKSHFLTLTIRPAFFRALKTILKQLRCSFQIFKQIIISSRQMRMKSLRYFLSIWFIRYWNIASTLYSLKSITFHSNNPYGIIKAIFSLSFLSILICQYSLARSSEVNYQAFWKLANISVCLSIRQLFFLVLALRSLQFMHMHLSSIFLLITIIDAKYGLVDSLIMSLFRKSFNFYLIQIWFF